jgi:hypothetical protein
MKTRIDHKKKHCLATETSMITIDQNGIVLVVFEPSHQVPLINKNFTEG